MEECNPEVATERNSRKNGPAYIQTKILETLFHWS
jgi:hypothetical protein